MGNIMTLAQNAAKLKKPCLEKPQAETGTGDDGDDAIASDAPASSSSPAGPALPMEEQAAAAIPNLPQDPPTYTTTFIDDTRGNGLVATAPFHDGDLIFRVDQPMILIPPTAYVKETCYYCFKLARDDPKLKTLKACKGCQTVHYCSKSCQVASWTEIHSKECSLLKTLRHKVLRGSGHLMTAPIRALIQLLLRLPKETAETQSTLSRCSTHRDEFMRKREVWQDIELLTTAAVSLCKFPPSQMSRVISLMCMLKINSFEAVGVNSVPLGLCFDILLASANHSCTPNSTITFNGKCASLRALRPIASGQEITISYIDVNAPLAYRQNELKSEWFFECRCPRCSGGWNEYEAFLNNPCSTVDGLSVVTDLEALVRHAREASQLCHSRFASSPEFLAILTQQPWSADSYYADLVLNVLTGLLSKLDFAYDQDTIALAPYPQFLVHVSSMYRYVNEYEAATVVEIFLAYRILPYLYPEPWHPVRVLRLLQLADRLVKLVDGSASLTYLSVLKHVPAAKLDFFAPLYALLLLGKNLCDRSHGNSNTSTLKAESSAILEWLDTQPKGSEPDIITMKNYGIENGEGLAIARKNFQQLELLADVDLLTHVLHTVDCKGNGHVNGARRRSLPGASPGPLDELITPSA